jgi:hypothetical protein
MSLQIFLDFRAKEYNKFVYIIHIRPYNHLPKFQSIEITNSIANILKAISGMNYILGCLYGLLFIMYFIA